MTDPLDNITIDDLQGDQRELAEAMGINIYIKLVKQFGGTHIYIPEHDSYKVSLRNAEIRREFDGYNYKDLAKKYDLTETSIRNIVTDLTEKIRKAPIDGQIGFYK